MGQESSLELTGKVKADSRAPGGYELSLHDLRTWLEDLSLMTVPEAVAYVRELIAGSNRLRSIS